MLLTMTLTMETSMQILEKQSMILMVCRITQQPRRLSYYSSMLVSLSTWTMERAGQELLCVIPG